MFKIVVAFFIVFGAIVWGQHHAGSWITQHAADLPPQDDLLPQPTVPIPTIDPGQMSRIINTPAFTPTYRH
jgi:hypothetical protein